MSLVRRPEQQNPCHDTFPRSRVSALCQRDDESANVVWQGALDPTGRPHRVRCGGGRLRVACPGAQRLPGMRRIGAAMERGASCSPVRSLILSRHVAQGCEAGMAGLDLLCSHRSELTPRRMVVWPGPKWARASPLIREPPEPPACRSSCPAAGQLSVDSAAENRLSRAPSGGLSLVTRPLPPAPQSRGRNRLQRPWSLGRRYGHGSAASGPLPDLATGLAPEAVHAPATPSG
jgi:hypothetical protein